MSETKMEPNKQLLFQNRYPPSKFAFQLCFMIITLFLWCRLVQHTISYYHQNPMCVLAGFVIAQFLVDFVSGIMHWACDTWGHFQTPFVGSTLIRSFRMHHVDPQEMTKHGFVQTNASSCYPMPLFLGLGCLMTPNSFISQVYEWAIIFGVILGIMTNEVHKWAHMIQPKPHFIIRYLQNAGLILSHQEHHRHHQGQFDKSYCIINGWMNPFLEKIDFWRRTEKFISNVTGALPRIDDKYWRPKYK